MPGCAAVGCFNSAKKGFLMKKFPKDPKRRKEWAIKTKRDKWVPTDSSVLCEVHFKPEMWERTREDGSRRLRADAVPSLFPSTKPQMKCRLSTKRKLQITSDEPCIKISVLQDSIGVLNQDLIQGSSQDNHQDRPWDQTFEEATPQSSMEMISNTSSDTQSSHGERVLEKLSKKEQLTMYSKLCKRKTVSARQYRNKLRCAEVKIKQLQQQLKDNSKSGNSEVLNKLFNKDQMLALKKKGAGKSTKFMKWSNETVTKALELKFSCGDAGYEKLLEQNLPYPSIRTLQRRLENLKFESGSPTEVYSFLKIEVESFDETQQDCVLT